MTEFEGLGERFRFNEQVLERATEGFTAGDWHHRADGRANHPLWILGHLATSRRGLLRGLGADRPPAAWEASFKKGSQPEQGPDLPSSEVLMEDLRASGELLQKRLASLTSDEAAAPFPRKLADGSSTLGAAAYFLHWHESYHLGQIGILRKVCGKSGIA